MEDKKVLIRDFRAWLTKKFSTFADDLINKRLLELLYKPKVSEKVSRGLTDSGLLNDW